MSCIQVLVSKLTMVSHDGKLLMKLRTAGSTAGEVRACAWGAGMLASRVTRHDSVLCSRLSVYLLITFAILVERSSLRRVWRGRPR